MIIIFIKQSDNLRNPVVSIIVKLWHIKQLLIILLMGVLLHSSRRKSDNDCSVITIINSAPGWGR